jgi:hypothetical protein
MTQIVALFEKSNQLALIPSLDLRSPLFPARPLNPISPMLSLGFHKRFFLCPSAFPLNGRNGKLIEWPVRILIH